MTRRFKRLRDFDVALEIKNDDFIAPPRDAQRNWLLGRALNEFAADLKALDSAAARFVPGSGEGIELADRARKELADDEIMEDWQIPIMRAMAEEITESHGDVLEVGFGRGVSASIIQQLGVHSHTVIECNDSVVARFDAWKAELPDRDIRIAHGLWQDVIGELGLFDGIFFHTYPLGEEEYLEYIVGSTTFAEHFFPTAAAHLRPGGSLTYMTNEIDSLGREHQRLLLSHFESLSLRVVGPLELPEDLRDAWWADTMVVVRATMGGERSESPGTATTP